MEGMKKKGPRGNVNNNNNIERRAKIASTTTKDFCACGHRFCSSSSEQAAAVYLSRLIPKISPEGLSS